MFGCGCGYGNNNTGSFCNPIVIILVILVLFYQGLLNTRNCNDNSGRNALTLLFLFWLLGCGGGCGGNFGFGGNRGCCGNMTPCICCVRR